MIVFQTTHLAMLAALQCLNLLGCHHEQSLKDTPWKSSCSGGCDWFEDDDPSFSVEKASFSVEKSIILYGRKHRFRTKMRYLQPVSTQQIVERTVHGHRIIPDLLQVFRHVLHSRPTSASNPSEIRPLKITLYWDCLCTMRLRLFGQEKV